MKSKRGLELVLACTLAMAANEASAYCRMTTADGAQVGDTPCGSAGEPLEWETTCLTYAVDADGSRWMLFDETEAAVDAGFFAWTEVQCEADVFTDLRFQPLEASTCKKAEYNDRGGNVNTVAFLDPWEDPNDGSALPRQALAITVVWHDENTGQILDADMLINDTRRLCPPGEPSCGGFDVQSIVTHESGHFLGIGHSEVEEATMYFMSAPMGDISMRSLATDDINALCAIYPFGSATPVCQESDFEPIGGLDLNCEDATPDAAGGCSLATPQNARSSWCWALLALFCFTVSRRRRGQTADRY